VVLSGYSGFNNECLKGKLDSTNMPNEQELSRNINNSKKYGNANLDRHNEITSIMLKTTAWRRTTLKPI
jgi:hypothetical protein